MKVEHLVAFAFALAVFTANCDAAIVQGSVGLVAPATTIEFDEIILAANSSITTEYSALGITFSSGVFYDTATAGPYPGVQAEHVENFDIDENETNPWSVFFNAYQTQAAFGIATHPNFTTVTALLNGAVVESATFSTDDSTPALAFITLTGIAFDEIELSTGGDGFAVVDNIQFGVAAATVPEPTSTTLGLLALGCAVGFYRRRNQATF